MTRKHARHKLRTLTARLSTVAALVAALGFSAPARALPYSEVGMPAGRHAYQPPRGWVIVIHQGGWKGVGMGEIEHIRPAAVWLNHAGWATLTVDYRPGALAEDDIRAFYDQLRARVGARTPICALGQSAGAQLALMLAAVRPRLACVIAEGAPVDLPALATQRAYDPASGRLQRGGPLQALALATEAFGRTGLLAHSPVSVASHIRAAVLATISRHDPLVPLAQLRELRRVLPAARTMAMNGGTEPFIHAGISRSALRAYNRQKRLLLDRVARGR